MIITFKINRQSQQNISEEVSKLVLLRQSKQNSRRRSRRFRIMTSRFRHVFGLRENTLLNNKLNRSDNNNNNNNNIILTN